MPLLTRCITSLISYFSKINIIIGDSITSDGISAGSIAIAAQKRVEEVQKICRSDNHYTVNVALKKATSFKDNAHRLVHVEDILWYKIKHELPNYRPILICTYLNMCSDCEQIVSMFANIQNGGDGIIVVSEKESPGEEGIRRNAVVQSLVKKNYNTMN